MSTQFDVFLSHSSVDKPWVIKLKSDLLRYGVSVWLDRDEIRPGSLFAEALESALDACRTVALIVSPEAISSGWVKEEYYRALSLVDTNRNSVQIIPVLLREAELPGFLQSRTWVDFRDETVYDQSVWELVWGITGEKPAQLLELTANRWAWALRIRTGRELVNTLRDIMLYDFNSEGITSEHEAELAGNFLNFLQDLGDVLPIYDPGDIVKTEFLLNSCIKELEENNLLVFGGRQLRKVNRDGKGATYPIATIRIVRSVMTPEREAAAKEWDEIVSKLDEVGPEEREKLFRRLAELLVQFGY